MDKPAGIGKFYPSIEMVTANTSPTRDRFLDTIRLASLLTVISGHGIMMLAAFNGDTLTLDNLLSHSRFLQLFTWILQCLPLFFFAGAASSLKGWERKESYSVWLFSRIQRLYRPVFYYLLLWAIVLPLMYVFLPYGWVKPIAGISIQLLWFLGVYVLVLASMGILAKVRSYTSLAYVLGSVIVVVAIIDVVRLGGGPSWLGLVNFWLVWLIPGALGVAYMRGLLTVRLAAVMAIVAFIFDIVLVRYTSYELSLVTVAGQKISNMTPPSLLLIGHCFVICGLVVVLKKYIVKLADNTRAWWFIAIGNTGAMTLYLWHLPALFITVSLFHAFGIDRYSPSQPWFWLVVCSQMIVFYLFTSILFTLLYRLENVPLPWWDSKSAKPNVAINVVVSTMLVVAGVLTLLISRWGFNGPGLPIVIGLLVLLFLARLLLRPIPKTSVPTTVSTG